MAYQTVAAPRMKQPIEEREPGAGEAVQDPRTISPAVAMPKPMRYSTLSTGYPRRRVGRSWFDATVHGPAKDWVAWHDAYADEHSALSRRLRVVRGFVDEALSRSPAQVVRIVSVCAGRGDDLVPVLRD